MHGGLIPRSLYAMRAQCLSVTGTSPSLSVSLSPGVSFLPVREKIVILCSSVQSSSHYTNIFYEVYSTLLLVSSLCVDAPSTVALRLPGTTMCLQAAPRFRIPQTSRFGKYSDFNTSRKHRHLRHSCMHIGSRLCVCPMMPPPPPPWFGWDYSDPWT
jgi:hypothetical protein